MKGDDNLFEGLIGRLMSWAGPRGLINFPHTKMINIYHDNPQITDEDKLRLSVCITVPKDTKTEGEIGKMKQPKGKYIVGSFEINSLNNYSGCFCIFSKTRGNFSIVYHVNNIKL